MKLLPTTYTKNSYNFTQVDRIGDVAIYEQIDPESGRRVAYEVFEVLKKQAFTLNGYDYPAKETTPSNEQSLTADIGMKKSGPPGLAEPKPARHGIAQTTGVANERAAT